jgi:hypothetical protein
LNDVEIQENLCFVGGIPIITKFAARQYSNEIRLEAAAFVRQMYQTSTLTLQMFVSAGGLNVLVEFLDEDYDEARDLVLIGVNGIWNVFELQVNNTHSSDPIPNLTVDRALLPKTTSAEFSPEARSCLLWPWSWTESLMRTIQFRNSLLVGLSTFSIYSRKQRIM